VGAFPSSVGFRTSDFTGRTGRWRTGRWRTGRWRTGRTGDPATRRPGDPAAVAIRWWWTLSCDPHRDHQKGEIYRVGWKYGWKFKRL